jgi:hypothetical protein
MKGGKLVVPGTVHAKMLRREKKKEVFGCVQVCSATMRKKRQNDEEE